MKPPQLFADLLGGLCGISQRTLRFKLFIARI